MCQNCLPFLGYNKYLTVRADFYMYMHSCEWYVSIYDGFLFNNENILFQNTELAYILYNDQAPTVALGDRWGGKGGSRGGHTKGKQ